MCNILYSIRPPAQHVKYISPDTYALLSEARTLKYQVSLLHQPVVLVFKCASELGMQVKQFFSTTCVGCNILANVRITGVVMNCSMEVSNVYKYIYYATSTYVLSITTVVVLQLYVL